MTHTFLFEQGLWFAKGDYTDAKNTIVHINGEIRILHQEDHWLSESLMKLLDGSGTEFTSTSEIIPFSDSREFTTWKSIHPMFGELSGEFMIVADTILSTFISDSGEYTGCECLLQVDKNIYISRGFVFKGEEKLSSWAINLKKM